MSNPQGPDRHPEDATERTGELPAWGTPPPGGWGADPATTGAWSPERDPREGWAGQGAADAGWDPGTAQQSAGRDAGATGAWAPQDTGGWDASEQATRSAPVWGDEAASDQGDSWAVPTGPRRRRRAGEPADAVPTDAVPAASPASAWADDQATTAQPADGARGSGAWPASRDGEEPWAPPEAVRSGLDAKKWGLIGGGVLLVAILLVTALVWPAWALPQHLDQTALQTGVNQVLTEDYGLTVGAVQCPDDVTVSAGTTFSCQAVVDGEQVEVPGVVTSDEGDYQVNRV
ncbi:DUF4333 domain-containing protein [Pseudonocardia parietis]|uniref:DUF4333 domain-containing protein n=1 Tax=Pseudonocardia parietis TaxID=570936 RepID=A0ABS4VXV9_9PSEU|nr:DUF4333 domain-containing protein [Pseudonocardia parietis]MBP2368304.1 hypothetical protein [Pseudonocardia parietis]